MPPRQNEAATTAGTAMFLLSFGVMVTHAAFNFLGGAWIGTEAAAIAAGWALVWIGGRPRVEPARAEQLDEDAGTQDRDAAIVSDLRSLWMRCPGAMPDALAARIGELVIMLETGLAAAQDERMPEKLRYDMRATAESYLPKTIENYLMIPPPLRSIEDEGSCSAEARLASQVATIERGTRANLQAMAERQNRMLNANGRFLEDKFKG